MKTLADPEIRIAVLERVKTIQPSTEARWGRMSAHGMLCHCTDSFRCGLGEREVSSAEGVLQRTLMKWFALYFPMPWPKGVPTRPEVEPGVGGSPPVDFARDRKELLDVIDRFCRPDVSFKAARHPIFGPLTGWQWRRWGYLHMDHHLRQFGA